ncbi:snf family helicase [Suhomyces tanzawaensis NRRL Y-17324]|uniref:Helicase SWR1 n=1 Tax=Suhomyces tanzawaensis NRRL Y-17324 TaxID=984487 RepID=A0A1E4SKY4_9ASCO|nr:snf family helicase [Suhomyces tanzawaensis NRRL Y-17324]ODV80148.1 snf family helicase [Suhomyces tanzawaensis NRRL Y-17324]
MATKTERRRNSLRKQDTSIPQKRKNSSSIPTTNKSKKIKHDDIKTKESNLADIITKFNLARNELFQLKEYKSLVSWDPADFSTAILGNQIPELYETFLKDPKYQLKWDEGIENKDLSNLPLRLQKKVLAENEKELLDKYPFKDEVIQLSIDKEKELISYIKAATILPKVEVKKSRPVKPVVNSAGKAKKKEHIKQESDQEEESEDAEEEIDEDEEDDMNEQDENATKYKFKSIKISLPSPKVTHPSHIPLWKPEPAPSESALVGTNKSIVEFDPKPVTLIRTSKKWDIDPSLQNRLSNYLNNNLKSAILDEGSEFVTPEEYEKILAQQEELLRKLFRKTQVDNTLQLHGDKIELRKAVLPQTNIKSTIDPFRSTGTVLPKIQGAPNNVTYQDHFLSQGMAFSKIHQQMRKQHQLRTRRVAQMIEQHFKKKKGEKDRLAKERELNLKKISRIAVQAVKKRWTQASKVYSFIQQQKEEELKQIKGREHLSQMLEHSTQLLEAQLNKPIQERNKTEEESDEENSDSEDSLSSSDESDDNDEAGVNRSQEDNDMNLSIEELKRKYANLEDSVDPSSKTATPEDSDDESASDSGDESESSIDVNQGLSALYGKSASNGSTVDINSDYTEEQRALIEKLNADGDNSALESDTSISMSDDDDDDDEVSEEEHLDEESVKENGKNSELATLFSSNQDQISDNEEFSEPASSEDEDMTSDEDKSEPDTPEKEGPEAENDITVNGDDSTMNGDGKSALVKTDSTSEKESTEKEEIINGAKVKDVPIPSLLRGTLRPYQKQGLNWLASLYNNNTNGILADEMGLGKTIQTISLLSYLACEHHIWGPHLIIVPTSVMLNWEMEFKKFAPGFKVLTYYGSPQQRAQKRKGWNIPNAFHVCITSYQLVVHDHQSFKRRRWKYMILDEAHNIKNFRSTRWRALLNFNTENRLLLTGTPLQNNLIELWSLLYFLMPSSKVDQAMPDGFANLDDFQQWFGKPVDRILEQSSIQGGSDVIDENEKTTSRLDEETKNTVARLHQVLRPYLLRRLKKDVEKQMPGKYEHIVYCRLSKRQRFLYDEFMSRAKTKETLASGNFLSIINCLMQLRKVCNHPDLFEVRPIVTSLSMPKSAPHTFQLTNNVIRKYLTDDTFKNEVNLNVLNLDITNTSDLNEFVCQSTEKLQSALELQSQIGELDKHIQNAKKKYGNPDLANYLEYYQYIKSNIQVEAKERLEHVLYLNSLRCGRRPIYGDSLIRFIQKDKPRPTTDIFEDFRMSIPRRVDQMSDVLEKYSVLTPAVVALDMKDLLIPIETQYKVMEEVKQNRIQNPFSKTQVKLSIAFPDKSLLQYDCGKLQQLAVLLQDLVSKGHRALIFTQMTKVLDILEQFLNIHGYRYLRLDGATKIEDRQLLTERFNRDPKIPVFILSTRSGGLGINLTGADTVIFYDSDWNPAMDKQCQDRCHRIGQIRDVHIYRFVSEYTIESNILKKANQKRQLDNVVIQEGEFTTDYFGKFSVRDLVDDTGIADQVSDKPLEMGGDGNVNNILAQAEDEDDRVAANAAMNEVAVDDEDFNEESKSATNGGTPAQTPGPTPVPEANGMAVNGEKSGEIVDLDFEEGIGHVDEYMLRFISEGNYWD